MLHVRWHRLQCSQDDHEPRALEKPVSPAMPWRLHPAGLVKGESQGERLGNRFLTHIREVDAIVQGVRCFEDADVPHVSGTADSVRDIDVINTELLLADRDTVKRRRDRVAKDVKRGDKTSIAEEAVFAKLEDALGAGRPALLVDLSPLEREIARTFFLLSGKRNLFACNVRESEMATSDTNPHVVGVREDVNAHLACEAVVISAV